MNANKDAWGPTIGIAALATLGLLAACGGGGADTPVGRGAKLYASSGCPVCHGEGGRGDGSGAAALKTKPRDLTNAAAFKAARTPEALAKAIAEGNSDGSMPPYPYFSDTDRADLAAFVISLAGK